MRMYAVDVRDMSVAPVSDNELIDSVVDNLISEAVSHFNKIKQVVHYPEDDCRFFYNDRELNIFLQNILYPDKVWVSTIKDDYGNFFAYRVGRVCINKKNKEVRY